MFGRRSRPARAASQADDPTAPVTVAGEVVAGEVIEPPRGSRRGRDLDSRKVMVRFVAMVMRIPRYIKLSWRLMKEPTISRSGKAWLGGGLAYAVSPIDPIPGFIPVIGQLDDLALLLLAIRKALRSCPSEVADGHLRESGLSWEALERDLLTVRATTIWLAQRGGALAVRAGKAMLALATERVRASLPGAPSGGRS